MRRGRLWKLLAMGAISCTVGLLVRSLPAFFAVPVHRTSPRQWILLIVKPCIWGMGIAILFPMWQRCVRIHNFLLQCILFWIFVPFILLAGQHLVLTKFFWYPKTFDLYFWFLFVGFAAAGMCFYGIAKWLHYGSQIPGRHTTPLPAEAGDAGGK